MHIGPTNTSSYSMLDLNDHEHKELQFRKRKKKKILAQYLTII